MIKYRSFNSRSFQIPSMPQTILLPQIVQFWQLIEFQILKLELLMCLMQHFQRQPSFLELFISFIIGLQEAQFQLQSLFSQLSSQFISLALLTIQAQVLIGPFLLVLALLLVVIQLQLELGQIQLFVHVLPMVLLLLISFMCILPSSKQLALSIFLCLIQYLSLLQQFRPLELKGLVLEQVDIIFLLPILVALFLYTTLFSVDSFDQASKTYRMFFILVLLDYQQASICTIDKFFLDIPFLFPKGAYTFLLFRSLTYQIHTFSILQKVISFSGDSILLEFLSFEMGLFLMLLLNNPALIIVL